MVKVWVWEGLRIEQSAVGLKEEASVGTDTNLKVLKKTDIQHYEIICLNSSLAHIERKVEVFWIYKQFWDLAYFLLFHEYTP